MNCDGLTLIMCNATKPPLMAKQAFQAMGDAVDKPRKGLYIKDGKKVLLR